MAEEYGGPPRQDTICAALDRAVAAAPDRVFADFCGETYTYAEVDRLADALTRGLVAVGVKPGDTVATVLDNNVDAIVVWFAINRAGAISAPVNTAFRGQFLSAQIDDCQCAVVIAEAEYAGRIAAVIDDLPQVRCLFVRGGPPPELPARVHGGGLDELRRPEADPVDVAVTPEQIAMLVYTSGTTGRSKGCMISHNCACSLGWNGVEVHAIDSTDVIWTPLPLFHLNAIGACVLAALMAMGRIAIFPRFSVSQFWPDVERSGATTVALLGSMASLIAEAPETDAQRRCHGQLRRISAAPFPEAVAAKWRERFGAPAYGAAGYGMTEAPTLVGLPTGERTAPPGSSGRAGANFEVRIFDDNDQEVPPGTAGEVVCRPRYPNVLFSGYWNQPEATVKAWRNLWFHTGDLGKIDKDGWFYFVDRKKDYIRRRGENISTHEMESVFRQHPAIQDVAVHAVLSPHGEDEVKVTAEILPGTALSEAELCRWSIERVPYFAVPLYIEFRATLPRGATGKVLKDQLRAEGKTAATWDREAAGLTFTRR
ncbi:MULTISPECIES: AMP-binding protein [unclassified Sphingobium]|uniref:AMP-binding protein n=1 Tax=unclassified Sphingobium TaxID=2611147 RepID=UPI0035A67650